jgi:acetoin utilization deacetylase AcuC-like enzyme
MKNIPRIFCLEGGYNLTALSESVLITLEELLYFE